MIRRYSIFSTVQRWTQEIWLVLHSAFGAAYAILPYLINSEAAEDRRKEFTEQYPDPVSSRTGDDFPPRTRGLLRNEIDRCTGCGDCISICPTQALSLATDSIPGQTKLWVSRFEIDYLRCISCGLCVEVCQPKSLINSRDFWLHSFSSQEFRTDFGRGEITPEQKRKWEEWALKREESMK
jgi:formate hydrogenlyase subunit 6/NADH:ubiquinone oxidoreductase subunit I